MPIGDPRDYTPAAQAPPDTSSRRDVLDQLRGLNDRYNQAVSNGQVQSLQNTYYNQVVNTPVSSLVGTAVTQYDNITTVTTSYPDAGYGSSGNALSGGIPITYYPQQMYVDSSPRLNINLDDVLVRLAKLEQSINEVNAKLTLLLETPEEKKDRLKAIEETKKSEKEKFDKENESRSIQLPKADEKEITKGEGTEKPTDSPDSH